MKILSFPVLIVALVAFVISCKKSDNPPSTPPIPSCYLYKIADSAYVADTVLLYYNTDHQLISRAYYNNGSQGRVDSFGYQNKILIWSGYGSNTASGFSYYSKSFYTYTNTNFLLSSIYFLVPFNTNASKCDYVVDTAGQMATIVQTALRPGLGALSHTTRYEFDNNSNLRKVYYRPPGQAEYLLYEFLDYDNKPNPVYKHPPFTDYDFYIYGVDYVSKNNRGRSIYYSQPVGGVQVVSGINTYSRVYDSNGYLTKLSIFNITSNTWTNTKYYLYKCN